MKTTYKRQKAQRRMAHQPDLQRRDDKVDHATRTMFNGEADEKTDKIYGLIPVIEALRAGQRAIDSITIAEGARHERLRDLLVLAKKANVPVHRVPRNSLDRS
jgi:tRNA G18 (ribose-2'-O)-methylase SpoU